MAPTWAVPACYWIVRAFKKSLMTWYIVFAEIISFDVQMPFNNSFPSILSAFLLYLDWLAGAEIGLL